MTYTTYQPRVACAQQVAEPSTFANEQDREVRGLCGASERLQEVRVGRVGLLKKLKPSHHVQSLF